MLTITALNEFGADTADGLKRCMNMEDFYLELVQTVLSDSKELDTLENALQQNDLNTAFEMAHALKGIFANLALTPLTVPVREITELLRNRTETDYQPLLTEIKTQYAKLQALA